MCIRDRAGAGNVIVDSLRGISLGDSAFSSSDNNKIQGNYIGVNANGTAALGHLVAGISMSGVNNTIGTDSDGTNDLTEGNVISGNLGDGIRLADGLFAGTNHVIAGNFIGVDFTGNAALGNAGAGVRIVGSSGTVIGCLLYTSPSPRDRTRSRMPSSA